MTFRLTSHTGSLLALAFALTAPAAPATHAAEPDPNSPTAELASFKVRDGFEVSLFASEADGIAKPIQMRFDERGRLYVVSSTIYPQIAPGQIADDKVLLLEDTDGDGRADKTTVFARGLMVPTGIELGDHGVYVGNGTELLHFRDTNGDGVADERRVVLRGFGTGDAHQNINSFTRGPGGELWFSQGLHSFSRVETPWGVEKLDHAGIWRLRPRRLQLDPFFGNELPPHNPWGFAFDDWGQMFVVAGNGHGILYPEPILIRGHRSVPLAQVWENFRGRKLCGADIVGTSHLPDELQGRMIAGGFMNNAIYVLDIHDDGAGFRLTDQEPLVVSSSTSFRPVDVKIGPDGAIWVADWFNPIIGHYQASFRHPDRDKTHGRIWRITAKGRSLVHQPDLANASVPELLEKLQASERWTRYQTKRLLADADTHAVTDALAKWTAKLDPASAGYEHALFEAIGVYESHEVVEPALLERLLHAKDYRARAYAAGVIAHWQDRLADPLALLAPVVADEHPRVRLAAVVSLAYVPRAEAVSVAAAVTDKPMDPFLDYALKQAVYVLKPHWLPALNAGTLGLAHDPKRLEFVLRADASPDTLRLVREQLESAGLARETRQAFLGVLLEAGDDRDVARLLDEKTYTHGGAYDAELHAQFVAAVAGSARARGLRPPIDLAPVLAPLIAKPDEKLRAAAMRLAGAWKLEPLRSTLRENAESAGALETVRRAAIEGLSALGGSASAEVLTKLAADAQPQPVRLAAIVGLVPFDSTAAAERAATSLARDTEGASVPALLPAFLQRKDGPAALAKALAAKPPARDAARSALRLMNATGRQDAELVAALTSAAGIASEPLRLTPEETRELAAEILAKGDAARGREIFRRAEIGCVTCHAVAGEGGNIGPDLGAIGRAQPLDFIIGAVLEPNREVKEGFEAIEIVTKEGESFQGFKVRADKNEVVLRDPLQQREVRIPAKNIKQQVNRGSLMPAGLVNGLTRAELRDLFRYLAELGKPKP
jgi:putative heme-binding domain-containing protein